MSVEPGGNEDIRRFVAALGALGVDVSGTAIAGDLSDLLWTLERAVERLRSLRDGESSGADSPAHLVFQLEMMITDEIPPIIRDLVPPLRRVRKALYRGKSKEK
jgi:hypothetical protein